jgi:hypothetical protein
VACYFLHCCASSVPSRGIGGESGRDEVERKEPDVLTILAPKGRVYICICPLTKKEGELGAKVGQISFLTGVNKGLYCCHKEMVPFLFDCIVVMGKVE